MIENTMLQWQQLQATRIYGKYAGHVVDNRDPGEMGRVKVKAPAILADQEIWAMPCVPYAGDRVGFHFIPAVGAGVWVEFEAGDVSRAIWSGCYWVKGQLPTEATSPDIKLIATDKARFKIDDSAAEVVIENQDEARTTWGTEVTTEVSPSTHTVSADGVVSESSPGKVEVGAGGVTINNGAFKVT